MTGDPGSRRDTTGERRGARALQRTMIRRNGMIMVLCTVLLCVYQVAEASVALLLGWLADHVLADGDLLMLGIGLLLLGTTIAVVSLSWRTAFRLLQSHSAGEGLLLRDRLIGRVLDPASRPRTAPATLPADELPTVIGEDAVTAVDPIEIVPVAAGSLIGIAFCAAALAAIDAPLGAGVLLGVALMLAILHLVSLAVERRGVRQQEVLARVTARLADVLRGLRALGGVNGARPAYEGYARLSAVARGHAERLARLQGGYEVIGTAGSVALVAGVGIAAGYRALSGEITAGDLITVVALSQFVSEPMRTASRMPRFIRLARAAGRRVSRVAEPVSPRLGGTVPPAGLAPVLSVLVRDRRFDAGEGEFTAVQCHPRVAEAIVRALADGEQPERGTSGVLGVLLRDCPVEAIAQEELRATVLADTRNPALFGATVGEAVRLQIAAGREGREEAEARAARVFEGLRLGDVAPLGELVRAPLREGAGNISGGQRQRLALARALLADPEILVLIDPSSSVDSLTGMAVARTLVRERRGRSTVVLCAGPAISSVAGKAMKISQM